MDKEERFSVGTMPGFTRDFTYIRDSEIRDGEFQHMEVPEAVRLLNELYNKSKQIDEYEEFVRILSKQSIHRDKCRCNMCIWIKKAQELLTHIKKLNRG